MQGQVRGKKKPIYCILSSWATLSSYHFKCQVNVASEITSFLKLRQRHRDSASDLRLLLPSVTNFNISQCTRVCSEDHASSSVHSTLSQQNKESLNVTAVPTSLHYFSTLPVLSVGGLTRNNTTTSHIFQ